MVDNITFLMIFAGFDPSPFTQLQFLPRDAVHAR